MAKQKPPRRETSLPLVIATIVFALGTIGLGVFAYTQTEDIAAAKANEASAKKLAAERLTNQQKTAVELAVYRVYLGIATPDEVTKLKEVAQEGSAEGKAAEKGWPQSMFYLGLAYEGGLGVDKDVKEALKWYKKAAAKGHEQARKKVEERED